MAGTLNDDDWTPPTAADLKIIEARQERSNQISKLMGEYMLKGYRMLDRLCHCGTILLQNRNGVDYCVACSELETECAKDDPVLSSEAARVAALEGAVTEQRQQQQTERLNFYEGVSAHVPKSNQPVQGTDGCEMQTAAAMENGQQLAPTSVNDILKHEIESAGRELHSCGSIQTKIQLCNLIKAASEALTAFQQCSW